ncbi:protein kinase [Candidatus Woesearchaeota archaeon]|nr:protein kinase [Candidatus Woesearchaeota archaeon]
MRYILNARDLISDQQDFVSTSGVGVATGTAYSLGDVLELDGLSYKIESLIGEGGFSEVYKASCGNEEVAIKALKKDYLDFEGDATESLLERVACNEQDLKKLVYTRFCKEHSIMSELNHNSIPIVGGIANDFYVMELLSPMRFTELDNNTYKRMVLQLAECLDYLSSEEIVHKDIKPDNLCVDSNGDFKLIDFGAYCHLGSANPFPLTYSYAAPELLTGEVNSKTDIFSAGRTLQAMCGARYRGMFLSLEESLGCVMELYKSPLYSEMLDRATQPDVIDRLSVKDFLRFAQRLNDSKAVLFDREKIEDYWRRKLFFNSDYDPTILEGRMIECEIVIEGMVDV